MARPLRIAYENALYHVVNRGHRREAIFIDDRDREEFLARLAVVQVRFNLVLHAYCLMGNHYHLLVSTPDANLSRAIHTLNSSYAAWFRARRQLVGSLFQGRFRSVLVEKERHLAEVSAYIHLNPVRAGLTQVPERWKWSSMAQYLGKKTITTRGHSALVVTIDEVLGLCGGRKNYLALIGEVARRAPDKLIYGANSLLGEAGFVDDMKARLREKDQAGLRHMPEARRVLAKDEQEVASVVRSVLGLKRERPFVRRRGDQVFKLYLWALRRHGDHTLRELAERLDMTLHGVSKMVSRMDEEIGRDKHLKALAERIDRLLTNINV